MHRNLTPEQQGRIWQEAGGLLEECWYREGSVERRLWEKGWRQAEAEDIASEHMPSVGCPIEEEATDR